MKGKPSLVEYALAVAAIAAYGAAVGLLVEKLAGALHGLGVL